MCLCAKISSINSDIEVTILQHPSEVKQPLGTARILALSLDKCKIFVGEDFSEHKMLREKLNRADLNTLVLYPNSHSHLLTSESSTNDSTTGLNASAKRIHLLILDGTWKKAFKIYQSNPQLHHLTCVHLPENLQGNYRLRKAPKDNALSTVEAAYHALSILEKNNDFAPLMIAFDALIEMQLANIPAAVRAKNYGL